jgi:multiple sugar transport system permease protein
MTAPTAAASSSLTFNKPQTLSILQRQRMWGWVFLSPWIIGFLVFTLFPIIASLVFSFTEFKIGEELKFVGLQNWQKLFTDPMTVNSLGITLRFGLLALPISILLPLGMAALLNSKLLVGKPIFRVLFYMPYMVPAISSVFVWQSFLNGSTGWFNRILRLIGISDPPNWLFDPRWLTPGLVLFGIWGVGNAMLTMLASMQGVPTELYEAGRVDGAGPLTLFRRITLPMISPVIFYNLVLSVIGLMQYFIVPWVLSNVTRSNPETNFINLHLYRTAFQFGDMGYAAAIAWFLFALALLLTAFLFATSRRWVYYASGD